MDSLSAAIVMSTEDLKRIEVSTVQQSNSAVWLEHRCGRITASNLKRVYTRAVTLQKDPTKDSSAILTHVMGYDNVKLHTYAIKHGNAMEPHAKIEYAHIQQRHHKKLVVHDTGLHVHPQHSYWQHHQT